MADLTELENRVTKLEDEQCCRTIFFENALPTKPRRKTVYINEETGEQFFWNGTDWVGPL